MQAKSLRIENIALNTAVSFPSQTFQRRDLVVFCPIFSHRKCPGHLEQEGRGWEECTVQCLYWFSTIISQHFFSLTDCYW